MRKIILFLLPAFFSFHISHAQLDINIPFSADGLPGKNMTGYYQPGLGKIIINTEHTNGITHLFYDTALNLLMQYDMADGRTLIKNATKEFFLDKLSIQHMAFEVYAFADSAIIYKLDPEKAVDTKIASIKFRLKYADEQLIVAMPNDRGCNFLTVSLQNKKSIIYEWELQQNTATIKEIELPKSTLSKAEKKERGDFLEIKYKNLFYAVSARHTNKPGLFQFPAPSQLFFNDTSIYILNKLAYEAGINVFKIDIAGGTASSTNYFLNKIITDSQAKYELVPVATVYDSLLIIQNSSPKTFEYYYYNIITGKEIARYETKPNNSLYSLVHSPLQQIGSFGSSGEEKELDNEKLFIKRKNSGFPFITPVLSGDSLVLTFGSLVPTQGAEGMLLSFATMGFGMAAGIGVSIGDIRIIPYLTSSRNKFLYAHSKFSLKGLQPSMANNVRTNLDDFLEDNKLRDLAKRNSVVIELPGILYVGLYDKKTKKYTLTKFQQH